MKNNGFHNIEYKFGEDKDLNSRISFILNEAVHTFRYHADGNWKSIYKPRYAQMLATEIKKTPYLIKKLIKLKDPLVSNITYYAIDLIKENDPGNG